VKPAGLAGYRLGKKTAPPC